MKNYWHVILKNGKSLNENNCKWSDIKNDIEELSLHIPSKNQKITLPKGYTYDQAKTASANLNGQNASIESRYISFQLRNNIVKIRVDENTNNISIEVE